MILNSILALPRVNLVIYMLHTSSSMSSMSLVYRVFVGLSINVISSVVG